MVKLHVLVPSVWCDGRFDNLLKKCPRLVESAAFARKPMPHRGRRIRSCSAKQFFSFFSFCPLAVVALLLARMQARTVTQLPRRRKAAPAVRQAHRKAAPAVLAVKPAVRQAHRKAAPAEKSVSDHAVRFRMAKRPSCSRHQPHTSPGWSGSRVGCSAHTRAHRARARRSRHRLLGPWRPSIRTSRWRSSVRSRPTP